MAALELLVGAPTAQGLVRNVLTAPALTDEDLVVVARLLRGCRALRAAAADGALALWDTEP
jgi:hypothetical protein